MSARGSGPRPTVQGLTIALFLWLFTAPLPAIILDWLEIRLYYDGDLSFWLVTLYMLPVGLVSKPLGSQSSWAVVLAIYYAFVSAAALLCNFLLKTRAAAEWDSS